MVEGWLRVGCGLVAGWLRVGCGLEWTHSSYCRMEGTHSELRFQVVRTHSELRFQVVEVSSIFVVVRWESQVFIKRRSD